MLPLLLLAAGGCHAQPVESNLIIPSSSSSSSSYSPSPLAMAANCSQTRLLPGQLLVAAALFGLVPKDCSPVVEERLRRETQGLTCSEAKSCPILGADLLQTVGSVATEAACHSLCRLRGDCSYYTWYDSTTPMAGFCFLFSKCGRQDACEGCLSGPLKCPDPEPSPALQDCTSLRASPPSDGHLDCYSLPNGEEECHLRCNPGFATTGSSVISCSGPAVPSLVCEPAALVVTGGDWALQQVEVYSTSSAACRHSMPSLPSLFADHSLTYVNGRLLLCGGSHAARQECYQMSKDSLTWEKQSKFAESRSHHASVGLRGQLHLLGGGAGSSNSSEVWSETFGWAPMQALPMVDGQEIPTDGCGAQISSHQFLLAGGRTCPTCAFVYNSDSDIWSRVGDMSHGRSSHGCTSYSSPEPGQEGQLRVLVAGGWAGGDLASAEVFDPELMSWRLVGSLTGPRRGLSLETIEGGKIVAVGGRHSTAMPSVDIFDPVHETWTAGPPLGRRRAYHAVAAVPASLVGCHL